MPKNKNRYIVSNWLEKSKILQQRKYYTKEQLFSIFRNELSFDHDIITLFTMRGFVRNLNSYAGSSDKFHKIQNKCHGVTNYIILAKNDKSDFQRNAIRISPRKQVLSRSLISELRTPSKLPSKSTQSQSQESTEDEKITESHTKVLEKILKQKKSDSPMALSLFLGKERAKKLIKDLEEPLKNEVISYGQYVMNHIQSQINKLGKAHLTFHGWTALINNYDHDEDEFSPFAVYDLRLKAYYLQKLYQMSLKYYDTISDFDNIAKLALAEANYHLGTHYCHEDTHLHIIKHPDTLLLWFRQYRENDAFPNSSKLRSRKSTMPFILSSNPDLAEQIITYCKEELSTLTSESVHHFVHETAIPNLVETIQKERNDYEYDKTQLFKEYQLKKLTVGTIYKWMLHLGFKYETRKKCYYVDNHENPQIIQYRNEFISRYFNYERRCFRWISITAQERSKMIEDDMLDTKSGYKYTHNGTAMFEYHVDDHIIFQERCSRLPYGGNLSIRKDPNVKPLMILGQDECIFKQFIFSKGYWLLPDGTKQLVPKDEGQGVMLSSFVSRELGYGFEFSDDVRNAVNAKRRNNNYSDEEAAILKLGSAKKNDLTDSPFVRELEYGSSNEGYWTYESMILQLEDCIDVLNHTHPQFEFLFLFDHSNGHGRVQPNGLSVTKISIKYGGKEPKIRNSKLTTDEFGPFHTSSYKLQPGSEQSMIFEESDAEPCYLNVISVKVRKRNST